MVDTNNNNIYNVYKLNMLHMLYKLNNICNVKNVCREVKIMIISIFNQKGGVGKSTTAINLASALAEHNKSVLVIDLDPQANTTNALGIDDDSLEQSIYSLLLGLINSQSRNKIDKRTIKSHILKTPFNVDVIPSEIALANAELNMVSAVSRETLLSKIVKQLEDDYEYILIDCPPSLGLLSINGLSASDNIIVPVYPSYFSVKGITQLLNTVELVKDSLKPQLDIMGVLVTKYDQRISRHREIKEDLMSVPIFKNKVFNTAIRTNQELEKAQDNRLPINYFNRDCNGHEDYMNLAKEVINYGK